MKTIDNFITEKIRLSSDRFVQKKQTEKTLFPYSKAALVDMIKNETHRNGLKCSLNHIDISNVDDLSFLFCKGWHGFGLDWFDGDISEWDVSEVTSMEEMFHESKFTGENGDISEWDVRNVRDMNRMFMHSKFKGDLSKWRINDKCDCRNILDIIDDFPPEHLPKVPAQWDAYIAHLRTK